MPLFSEHISNMYYSGSPSYSSPYSSYTSSFSPLGTSYSASYLNPGGNYTNHSSISSSYSRAPLTSRWVPGLSRSYSPMLTPISERGTASPIRINSPRRVPISKRSYGTSGYTQRPININTADIDVSKDKYRRKSIERPSVTTKPPLRKESVDDGKEKSPFMPRVDGKPETGIDSSPGVQRGTIKRGRTVVRLHTVKRRERDSPRKPVETAGPQDSIQNASVENSAVDPDSDTVTKTSESKNWRKKLSEVLTYPEKKEEKSLGTKFMETHLVKNVEDEFKIANNDLRNDIPGQSTPSTLQPHSEIPMPCKSPDRRCSMELLAEQASVLDALIKSENLSTIPLDLSKIGITEEEPKTLVESIIRKKSDIKKNPLKTTKSDQSLHENLKSSRNSKDSNSFSKRRSLKKSFSGGSISRLDSITEFPKDSMQIELPAIEEIRTSIKINKADEKPKPKLKTKITASVEITPPASPLKFRIENVTVEEKVHTPKKEISFTSIVEDSTTQSITIETPQKKTKEQRSIKRKTKNVNDSNSPEPDDGNFWDKIGKRETVYLIKRKQNLDEVKEKHKRALFWFPEGEDAGTPDTTESNETINAQICSEISGISERIVTQEHRKDQKEMDAPFVNIPKPENNNNKKVEIDTQQEQTSIMFTKQDFIENKNSLQKERNDSKLSTTLKDNTINNSELKSDLNKQTAEFIETEGQISASCDTKPTGYNLQELPSLIENMNLTTETKSDVTGNLSTTIAEEKDFNSSQSATKVSQNEISNNIMTSKDTPTKKKTKSPANSEKSANVSPTKPREESENAHEKKTKLDNERDITKKKVKDTSIRKKTNLPTNSGKPTDPREECENLPEKSAKLDDVNNIKKEGKDVSIKIKSNSLTKNTDIKNNTTPQKSDFLEVISVVNAEISGTAKKTLEGTKEPQSSTINTETSSEISSNKPQRDSEDNLVIKKVESITKPIQKSKSLDKNVDGKILPVDDTKINIVKNSTPKKLKSAKKSDPRSLNKKQNSKTSPKLKDSNTVQICPVHGVVNKTDKSSAAADAIIDDQKTPTSKQPADLNSMVPVNLLTKTEKEPTPDTTIINNTVSSSNDIPNISAPETRTEIQSENIPKISPLRDSQNVHNEQKTEKRTEEEPKAEAKIEQVNQIEQLSKKTDTPELMQTPKKPVKEEKALKPLIATPRPLQKRVAQIIHSSDSSDSSSDEESSEEEESDTSEDSTEFFECENNADGRTSTGSNDSGFDSSAPTSPASFMQIKKDCDVNCHRKCEKLTANLCGVNQRLLVEALATRTASKKGADSPGPSSSNAASQLPATDILEQELEQSTAYGIFRKTGRFTPPARSIPRFKKYMIDDFQFIKVLGKGSFGKVLLAELRDTEYYYAVKCLKKDVVLEDDDVECTLIERKVLALGTNHPYLCHLFATFQTDSHLFFVMEYLNGGDLMFHIQQSGRFPEARARFYGAEIVSGLKFLHKRGIVYRDLKLDNILLDFDGHVRIADFGMCKLQIYLDKTADTFCGTPDYMAPEIIKGLKYNQTVDWWSFGVLLYEMLIGQSPFSGCDEDELFWSICNEMPSYPRFLSQEALTILTRLLDKDARTRLGGVECMHGDIRDQDFFHQIHWERLERRDLEAPFRPRVRHPLDTQYFDRAFTGERPRLTAVEPHVLRSMDQEPFRGFSYTNPNATDR